MFCCFFKAAHFYHFCEVSLTSMLFHKIHIHLGQSLTALLLKLSSFRRNWSKMIKYAIHRAVICVCSPSSWQCEGVKLLRRELWVKIARIANCKKRHHSPIFLAYCVFTRFWLAKQHGNTYRLYEESILYDDISWLWEECSGDFRVGWHHVHALFSDINIYRER